MSKTIKLNPGIEGAEVRNALRWVKHITEGDINKMKIGRTGFLFSFIDSQHVIAGKVFIPSSGELWHSEKEVGFNCKRLFNAFSIFKRRDKTELYVNENRLFLKNGALKWRYDMEEVEQAAKIDFSKIPTPAITLKLEDVLPLKQINKGRRANEKADIVAFKYGGGKATIYLHERYSTNIIKLAQVKTEGEGEGEGEGVALYNLLEMEKLLKDAKAGVMRIEEDKALKLNVYTGKATKAILYLAPLQNSDLTEEIRGEGVPSIVEEQKRVKAELDMLQEQEKIEQEKAKGFREAIYKSEIVSVCFFNYLEGTKDAIYRDAEGYEYQSNALNFDTLAIEKIKELKRIDKAATGAAEQVERDKDTFSEHLKRLRAERAAMSREEREEAIAKDVQRYNERRKRLQNETVLLLTHSKGDKNGRRR